MHNLGVKLSVRKTTIARLASVEDQFREIEQLSKQLRKRLDAAKERLPQEREIPQVYRQVSDLATQSGLAVALFQPKPPEDRDVLTEVPIAVTAEGTYHQMGAFLQRMGQMPRIVSLGDFRMLGIDRGPGTVRAELTLATFVFRPEGAPPPPAKPGAPGTPAAPPPPAKPGTPAAPASAPAGATR